MNRPPAGNEGPEQNAAATIAPQHAVLIALLDRGPCNPHERLAFAYGKLAEASLALNPYLLSREERDIADLLRYAEDEQVNLVQARERVIASARAALAGDRNAFDRMVAYVNRLAVRRALNEARRLERGRP